MNILFPRSTRDHIGRWGGLLLFITLMGLVSFGIIHTNQLADGNQFDYRKPLIGELTGVYTAFLLLPGIFWLWRKRPLHRPFILSRLPMYLAATVVYGLTHTTLMTVSRHWIYALLDMGAYEPGILVYRYLMEFQKQVPIFWIVVALLALADYIRRHQERQLQAAQLREQLSQARLDSLQQQLNPHFLFNTLNLISARVYEDAESADNLIGDLSGLLRTSLELGREQQVSVTRETEFLRGYLRIMHERFGSRVSAAIEVEEAAATGLMPSLMLQPLVENSIKHRLDDANGRAHIKIQIRQTGERLHIRVEDSGSPVAASGKGKTGMGLGLGILEERLEMLYKGEHSLSYGFIGEGSFRFDLEIPFHKPPEIRT